ncbi:hypothetical protein ACFLWZ_05730 [Chloroflexota bacterium]
MADIKSAREIALEKIAQVGEPTAEERMQWRYEPEGEQLAARYIEKDVSITSELNKYEEDAKKHVVRAAANILVRNINLPESESALKTNKKAMEGIKAIKRDKAAVENVYSKIRHVFDHFAQNGEQQKQQAYQSLKQEFTAKVRQAMQQQYGAAVNANIDIERQPQFQEEWRRRQSQLDQQYIKTLDEYKQELQRIT